MVKLTQMFAPFRVLVLGDFMLDTYTTGKVKRISPEAPVPVMEVMKQDSRPGGAGNVVLNLLTLVASCLTIAKECRIPAIVDPKGSDFSKYRGATVLKPNLSEAYAAAKCSEHSSLEEVAEKLRSLADILMITRSEAGISVFEQGRRFD